MKPLSSCLAMAGASMFSATVFASVIINEVDYDQPGSDTAEFIELFNTANTTLLLDSFSLQLINGATGSPYRSIDLGGQAIGGLDYFVICADSGAVVNCDMELSLASGWLQNGAPDGIALLSPTGIIDSMTYEGEIAGYTEGSALLLADSNTDSMSLARIPDGNDSNDNATDFTTACLTPGTVNIAGVGDCSVPGISPVPVPAAMWLFASGLLGITMVARKAR